jgi:HAD superfamily hydrolase (TIGR01509 family)
VSRLVLFIDDGGVMNDNERRGAQWRPLVGQFFAAHLGGTPEAWAAANYAVMIRMLETATWTARMQAVPDYAEFDRLYLRDWLQGMCEIVGVPAPPEEEGLALARQINAAIPPQIDSAYPGAVDAIRTLHARGHRLHTASGESASDLEGYLTGMGVRDCFGTLYGTDVVSTLKMGTQFYTRIFAHAGVAPEQALVVDDNPQAVAWAAHVGAQAVLVRPATEAGSWTGPRINRLAELPDWLARQD